MPSTHSVKQQRDLPLGMTQTRWGGTHARSTVFSLLVWLTHMTVWQSAKLNFSTCGNAGMVSPETLKPVTLLN